VDGLKTALSCLLAIRLGYGALIFPNMVLPVIRR